MYRIAMFNTRDEERPIAEAWAREHDVELMMSAESFKPEHLEQIQGFDGLTMALIGPLDPTLYQKLATAGIRQISQRSAGVDMYDLKAAREAGISITNVPSYSPESIAEFTLTQMLNLLRKTALIEERVQEQDFTWNPVIRSRTIASLTVAVLGTGRIGFEFAKRVHALGAKVIGFDLYPNDHAREILNYVDSVQEAVKDADVISIHMPATAENHHLFDKELLSQCKKGAYILNMARGAIIDTGALLDAIESGHIAGAGLDTVEKEGPYIPKNWKGRKIEDNMLQRILQNKSVLYTPHIAFYTDQAIKALTEGGLNAALEIIKTGTTATIVNKA